MIPRTARRATRIVGGALAVLAAASCSIYAPSLLEVGAAGNGNAGATNQAGMSGTTGDAGTGDGGGAGEPGTSGSSGVGGLAGIGGAAETGGTAGAGGTASSAGSSGSSGADSAGSAGSGGTISVGGIAGAGGTAGTGGSVSGSGGSAGAGATANGCAKLSVPLDDAADKAHFVISLTSAVDLSNATISMHVYVRAGSGGSIFNYVQDSGTYHFFSVAPAQRATLSSLSGWSTVTWAVGAQADSGATGIVKTSIKNIGVEISAQPASSWTNPTIVYLDSIAVTTPASSYTFDAASSVYPTQTTAAVSGQALWINGGATDTTAVGVTLSWQATCP